MRIVALVAALDHVCARYRIAAYRVHFERAGHQLVLRPMPRYWLTRWALGRDLPLADAVILQRRLLPAWQLRLLRRQARRLIFDFDDAVFLRDSYDPRGLLCRRRLDDFVATIQTADAVVAGNDWLRDQALRWTLTRRVYVIPTCVNPRLYPLARHDDPAVVRLAWIGSSSTLQGLARIRPILERLGAAFPQLRLQIICDRSLSLTHLPVDFRPWTQATETHDLAAADIGISWLPDDDWSRGKCGLKVLQYMAAGLPVVANPIGVQQHLVQPGVTGFLARDPEEWVAAVGTLVRDPHLRCRLGRAGRQVVEKHYDVRDGVARWLEVLRGCEGLEPGQSRRSA
ncbi:MAG: glycosyltransferase family 4 protein [Gemmataceae bacterium]|nr:glycosyltransferase family 4 protein [Gemmataceae bacterium]